jgi:hypothetical protein
MARAAVKLFDHLGRQHRSTLSELGSDPVEHQHADRRRGSADP